MSDQKQTGARELVEEFEGAVKRLCGLTEYGFVAPADEALVATLRERVISAIHKATGATP